MLKNLTRLFGKRDPDPRRLDIQIGRGTYGEPEVLSWGNAGRLRIGAFCSIADHVKIFLDGEHRTDWVTTFPFNTRWKSALHITGHPYSKGDVTIGNDVWLGYGAMILSGITIGDGAVVGCHALVTRDVPAYTIVGGNPAKPIRKRFPDDIIERLQRTQWWTLDDATLDALMPRLLSDDVEEFLAAVETLPGR